MAMHMYKSIMKIGDTNKCVVEINIPKGELNSTETEVKSFEGLHFIHILDRSYSMAGNLKKLAENVKQTLEVMSDKDMISIIWFSGEGECKTLLKGASINTPKLNELIDSLATPIGCTCFSEPLNEANSIIDDLIALCPNIAVTLFTDGQPCVSDYNKELKAIEDASNKMAANVIAINTIGYGFYYNEELLESISSKSMLGKKFHSSKIDDYIEIFKGNYEIYNDVNATRVEIECDESKILYMSRNSTKYSSDKFNINFLNKSKNQFFIVNKDDSEFTFKMNGEDYTSNSINTEINSAAKENFVYGFAYENAYLRNKDVKYILANTVKDKYLVDRYVNAFTAEERQKVNDEIKTCVFKLSERYKEGKCDENYIPPKDAFCVIDVMNILSTLDNCYYIPVSEYNRIGLKVSDTFNLFKKDNTIIMAPFNNLVWNEKHMNLSIKFMITGVVNINPKQAKSVGMDDTINSKMYRTHTIIKDGNLNTPNFEGIISQEAIDLLTKDNRNVNNFMYDIEKSTEMSDLYHVKFDLSKLPVINESYADKSTADTILNTVVEYMTNKAKLKVLNYQKSLVPINETSAYKIASFSDDQIKILNEHGLNERLEYVGVNNVTAEKNESDFYMSRLIEFALKGWSSLPTVDKVKTSTKLNAPSQAMKDALDMYESFDIKQLEAEIKKIKNEQSVITSTLSAIKMAKVLTSTWWDDTELDNKNNYTFSDSNNTLIIKNDYTKIYF